MRDRDWVELYFLMMHTNKYKVRDETKRMYRANVKRCYDRLAKPLTEDFRTLGDPADDEAMFEYGIDPRLSDYTDAELEDFFRDQEVHNTSPYDCSGKMCTSWIVWKRTPVGVAFVHRKHLDV